MECSISLIAMTSVACWLRHTGEAKAPTCRVRSPLGFLRLFHLEMDLCPVRRSGCTEHRTPTTGYPHVVALEELGTAEIFAELVEDLGLPVVEDVPLNEPDVVLLDTDGRHVLVELKRISTPTPAQVSRLVAYGERSGYPDALRVLVADRMPEAVRAELRSHGWGWLDLRRLAWAFAPSWPRSVRRCRRAASQGPG
jgi:hypothetical protein